MKKTLKAILTLLLCAALLIPTVLAATQPDPTAAAAGTDPKLSDEREEIVYANLTASGEVKDVYVVSILSNSQAGPVVDYGGYLSVRNLTNTDELTLSGDKVAANAPAGDFYYQGALQDARLPWLIDVSYRLQGKEVPSTEMAGKTGQAEICITTGPNVDADPAFFDNYMLQVTLTLDTSKCRNISASGATIANAGGDKLVTFTVMPGESAVLPVTADVTDFSMQGIEFAALPMSLDIDTPDTAELTDDLGDLSEAISELNDAVGELYSGSADLKTGAEDLKEGSSSFQDGLGTLNGGSGELITGSSEVMNALVTLSASLDGSADGLDVAALAQLPDTLDQLSDGIDNISAALTDLDDAFGPAYAALDAAIGQIPDAQLPQEDLLALYQNNPSQKDTLDTLSAYYAAAAETKATYEAVKEAFDAVGTALGQSAGSLDEISGALTTISEMIRTASEGSDAAALMLQLTEGLKTLSAKYELFHTGLVDYTSGVSSLAYSYGKLDDGLSGVTGGIGELNDGLGQLYDGTTELNGETIDMPEQVDDKVQELINDYDKSGFVPPSFVSGKNTNTVSVQFVFKTDKLEKAETASAVPETEAKDDTFWDRLLALFR